MWAKFNHFELPLADAAYDPRTLASQIRTRYPGAAYVEPDNPVFERSVAPEDVLPPGQVAILEHLRAAGGPLSTPQIAAAIGVGRNTGYLWVQRLHSFDLLQRQRHGKATVYQARNPNSPTDQPRGVEETLLPAERAVLQKLRRHRQPCSRKQVVAVTGGTAGNAQYILRRLMSYGLIRRQGWRHTAAYAPIQPGGSGPADVKATLTSKERRILSLLRRSQAPLRSGEIAARIGVHQSAVGSGLLRLKQAGLIQQRGILIVASLPRDRTSTVALSERLLRPYEKTILGVLRGSREPLRPAVIVHRTALGRQTVGRGLKYLLENQLVSRSGRGKATAIYTAAAPVE